MLPFSHGGTTQCHYQSDGRQVRHGQPSSRALTRRLSYPQQNKSLSDSADEILRLQGVSWFKRRAIAIFTLTLYIKHTTDEAGVEHIDIDQTLSGGIPGTTERRILDWADRDRYDGVYGFVTGKSRRIPVEEITDEWLKKDWTQDTIDDDIVLTDSWNTPDKNSYTWRAVQVIASSSSPVLFSPAKPDVGLFNGQWGKAIC